MLDLNVTFFYKSSKISRCLQYRRYKTNMVFTFRKFALIVNELNYKTYELLHMQIFISFYCIYNNNNN